MKSEIKAWRAAKRLKVSVKFLMKLRAEGVLDGWRYESRGDWWFDRGQVESLRAAHVGDHGTEEVAAELDVSERMVRRMVASGALPDRRFVAADGRRLGKLRFQTSDMDWDSIGRENRLGVALKGDMLNQEKELANVPSHRI